RDALHEDRKLPDLLELVDTAATHAPKKIGTAMRAAAADLPTAKRQWALVALTETALQALGAEALSELRARSSDDDELLPPDLAADLDDALARRLVRADGGLADQLPPGLSQVRMHAAVRALRKHAGVPLPRHV